MKRLDVLTLFPGLIKPFLEEGLVAKAIRDQLLEITPVDFRPFGLGKHRSVDDEPYGGGAGMVLRPEPIFAATRQREAHHREAGRTTHKILLTPQGRPFDQAKAQTLADRPEVLLLICGRYEGFDERIRTGLVDEEISLGDFITLGGEVAALTLIEAVCRLVPGVLGNPDSSREESFAQEKLEYPQYTRPAEFENLRVPDILLSGHHGEIQRWRQEQAAKRTAERRPDLGEKKTDG